MILAGGLIRTLDSQIPTQRALAIAGEHRRRRRRRARDGARLAGDVDLGGRVVVPGFTDSHVHFPTWALAQTEVSLDGCASLAEALERIRAGGLPGAGRWLRGYGWRSGDWTDGREPTPPDLDAVTGDVARRADREGLPLALAQLGRARTRGRRPRGRRRRRRARRATASRPASCARRRRGASRRGTSTVPDDEYLDAMRVGLKLANARGVTAVHDKDGWLGALRLWQQLGRRTR